MKFWKSSKGREEVISNQNNQIFTVKQGFLSMKLIQKGHFRVCFSTIVLRKIKTRHILKRPPPHPPHPPTMFRKFIRFGDTLCPYTKTADNKQILSTEISWKLGAIFESLPSTCCHVPSHTDLHNGSGNFWRLCSHYKKSAIWFSENEGGGPKAVWNFSKNSSVLV